MKSALSIIDDIYDYKMGELSGEVKPFREIVSVEEWIREPYFVGSISDELYGFWKDVIIEFENSCKNELILTGGLGTGKSYAALVIFLRKIYVLSCYSPVANYLDLATSSQALFAYLAISLWQAKLTGFGKLIRMIDSIPYFREEYTRDKDKSSILDFGEVAIISGSEIGHYRGGDLFGLILDEGNFRQGTEKHKLQEATDIYIESTNRRKMRFVDKEGNDKSFSIIVSSTDTLSSFTEERIKEGESDKSVMVVRSTTWQTKPHKYSGNTFWVYKGSEKVDPFIEDDKRSSLSYFQFIKKDPQPIDNLPASLQSDWIKVPVEFKKQFETNIKRALADIAGVASGNSGRLIKNEETFTKCFSKDGVFKHPFTKERLCISYQTADRIENYLFDDFKFDNKKKYYIHIDQSTTNDSTGIAISHKEANENGFFVSVDLMIKIDPPAKPDQISIRKVREFIFYLKESRGLRIGKMTYDQFASEEAIQEANNRGIKTERLSVDRDSSQYSLLVDLMLTDKIKSYYYVPLKDELLFLEEDKKKRKVDHIKGYAKDISDAVCGSVWNSWVYGKVFNWSDFLGD